MIETVNGKGNKVDINISAKVLQYKNDGSNKNEVLDFLKTFKNWVLSENTEGVEIMITDKRRGRNHLSIIQPGDFALSFNNGVGNYIFAKPEQMFSEFGIVYEG